MKIKLWQPKTLLPTLLVAFIALTRYDHFGSAISLPDGSVAAFFLAGLWFGRAWFFGLLLFEAVLIDYAAITLFGVSDFCITPAYAYLLPTYGTLWLAGRYAKAFSALRFTDSVKTFTLATSAITVAYLISNGSFYALSGYFGLLEWEEYLDQALRYYRPYTSSALLYILVALVLAKLFQSIKEAFVSQSNPFKEG